MSQTPLGPLVLGSATVHILNGGDLRHFLRDSLGLDESEWKGRYDPLFGEWIPVPVQAALIQTEGAVVLVDAPSAELEPGSELTIPGYTPPPGLINQLAELGVGPLDVTHIVISHTHFDHFNALAAEQGEQSIALYPNATVLVGRADWDKLVTSDEYAGGESLTARMFAPYEKAGRIQPVDADAQVELAPGVTVVPSPSETPGHLSVRVAGNGKTLYCVGDVYHHWVEVENRGWMVDWADREQTIAEREKLEEAALAEDAMLMASHIRGVGRLARGESGSVRWQDLAIGD